MLLGEILDNWGEIKHKTYKIQKEDTPELVAGKLGISLLELRTYHNFNCIADADVINAVFPSQLKFLLLKPIKRQGNGDLIEEPLSNVRFSSNTYQLPFRPRGLDNNYLGMYTIKNGDKEHTVKEEINVKWLATDTNDYSFFEINRISKVYVDEKENNTIADEFAEKTARVFYPLQVVVDSEGKWIDIHNYEDIKERWCKVKATLHKEFQGETIEECFELFENKLESNATILDSFTKDWFLRSFFNGINIEYKETLTILNAIKFPVSHKIGNVTFNVEQNILPTLDKYNLVNIIQKGVLIDSRSKDDFENDFVFPYNSLLEEKESEKLQGAYNAYYFLDPDKYTVDSLFLECKLELEIPQKITIVISNLEDSGKLIEKSKTPFYVEEGKKTSNILEKFIDIFREK